MVDLIGGETGATAPVEAITAVRHIIERHCQYDSKSASQSSADEHCTTSINANLLEAWRKSANDPDHAVCAWLLTGAPAGITKQPEACGILPSTEDEPECGVDGIATDFDNFPNYAGVDSDDIASNEVVRHEGLGHVKVFDSLDELRLFLKGEEPVLNKIGLIIKTRAGEVKKRMILDTKQSRIKQCSAKYQRVLLPRVLDTIMNAMTLLNECGPDEDVDLFVLDYKDTNSKWGSLARQ